MRISRQRHDLPPLTLSADTALTLALHANRTLICTGTHTHTHPTAVGIPGMGFFFFNAPGAVTTLASTSAQTFTSLEGAGTGYKLTNGGQYAETESDNANWLVTLAN